MGAGRRKLVSLWALALALACAQHTGQAEQDSLKSSYDHHRRVILPPGHVDDPLRGVTVIPPLRTIPVVRALNPAHNGQVCSTWGDFHYKTFDGDVFRFPGLCNYVFSAHCGAAYEDFNIQLRRSQESNATTVSRVIMKLDGLVVELTKSSVLVNGHLVQLPFSQSGVLIELSSSYLKVVARLGLVFMWNHDDSLLLELDTKYANKTCGLCGDFSGNPVFSEFLSHNVRLTPLEFGNLQKMDGPTEQCQDPIPSLQKKCSTTFGICEEILRGQLFSNCTALVDVSSYVEACQQDLCLCERTDLSSCICHTLAEYSRQCAHAGGLPQDWRGPNLCPQNCTLNMKHRECGSPCVDTCSNPQRSQVCEDHCVAGCFCPEGMVLDDIGQTGCVPVSKCSCLYNGMYYAPGANYSTDCTECTCSGGRWSCSEVPCPGTCSVVGGAHFSTFDERQYTVHGDCSYVLTKPCNSSGFTVLAELRKCGLTDSETCLKSVTLNLGGGQTVIVVKASGEVFVNQIYTQLPVSAANVTLFRPSTFFIIAQTTLGLQLDIQLVPTMQVFVRLAPELRGLTCGLCGNFNSIQADDFRTISGVVEGTAAAFFNTFKTQASCPNVKNIFEDPCSLSVENEKYAQHWCSQLTNANGSFAQCHATVNPGTYYSNCMFDTCNCEKSEDCMCAALSSYVRACAAKGVLLRGWRDGVCTKPTTTCPKSMTYHYHISTCQPTCRSLSEEDVTCQVNFVPVDGCTCPEGTFLDDSGKCVQATSCPCYHRGSTVPNGESVHDSGAICTCTQGTLTCIGGHAPTPVCDTPMVYFDCRNATSGATGAGCQKSCHTLDMACYSTQCVSGCVCPEGLVADGDGSCIAAEDCPCVHNEATYGRGETIRVGCNNCTCENRTWRCTDEPCLATCAVYGDGHFLTFDGRRYSFSGDCEYTLVQDHCGGNNSAQDSFRVIIENVPCGTTGTTCSKSIKIFLGSYELKLSDGKVEVVQKGTGQEPPYSIHQMGVYLVVETDVGLVLLWDRRTSIFLRLGPEFKGRVCGLCGNFDDNTINDFTTRSQSVVGNALEFGNSWKFSPSCPDALVPVDSCTANPYRKSWAQKQCSIINSATFDACHAHVEPAKYYEACVSDACACDSGGDCECFCTAVAAYAQACHDVGVCVSWRTPDICPLFCDYYNADSQCTWHYKPCGSPCMRTCQNPSGHCLRDLGGLEGCYPKCPLGTPIFDENTMQCVATCPIPTPPPPTCRVHGKLYRPGARVPTDKNCYSCVCTESGVRCAYDSEACACTYNGQSFHPGDAIYNTTDGIGGCLFAYCGANGTIERKTSTCSLTTPVPPTTFSFSTSPLVVSSRQPSSTHPSPTQSTAHTEPSSSATSTATTTPPRTSATTSILPTLGCEEDCLWSPWLDVSRPGSGVHSGDYDTLENLRAHGYRVCLAPRAVECRAEDAPEVPLRTIGQNIECSPAVGLSCHNKDQVSGLCKNYQIRVLCCSPVSCPTSSGSAQTSHPATWTVETDSKGPFTVSSAPVTGTASTPAPASLTPAPGTSTHARTTPSPTMSATSTASASAPGTSVVTDKLTSSESNKPCLQEVCQWTKWIDGSYPGSTRNSGDFDTFQNLRAKGYKFCEKPTNVECRAQFFPNTPLAELGQDVTCNREEGLICLNKNQLPPMCYNYEIRIQCCEMVNNCREETGTPETLTTTYPATQETSTTTQAGWTTGSISPSTKHTTIHSAPVYTISRATHTTEATGCQPQCNWTKWFDVDFPVPGPHGGDQETYSNILRKGEKICHQPEEITRLQCRAENHPEVSVEKLGQVVQCDSNVGLVCHNRDQNGGLGMCLNYEVRVLCCRTPKGCPTIPPVTPPSSATSVHTSSSSSTPHTSATSVHPASSTSRPPSSATSVPTSSTISTSQTSTTSVHTSSSTSTPTPSATSVHTSSSSPAPHTSATTVHPASSTSWPPPSATSLPPASSTSTPTSATSVQKTSASSASMTSTHQVSTTWSTQSPTVTTGCQPQCNWTKWFDVDFPVPGPHGGDQETYSNILKKGEKICHQPEEITRLQCRAENHPEVSVEKLGQVVQCDSNVGLVCHNRDQNGGLGMCLNYEVRVLCCRTPKGCPTIPPVTVPSTPTERTTSVAWSTSHMQTTSSSPTPQTSATSVHPASSSSRPPSSATSVHTSSSYSAPHTSATTVHPASSTSTPTPTATSVHSSSSSSAPHTSATSCHLFATSQLNLHANTQCHICAHIQFIFCTTHQCHHCAPSQLNIYIPNQHHQCAHIQLNLHANTQCHIRAHIQLFPRTTHQCHHCAPSQLILQATIQRHLRAHIQLFLSTTHHQLNLLATIQCHLFATSQLNLHANNQCFLCAHIQFIFCTTHQHHLCAPSKLNLHANTQCHICAHIQFIFCTTHQCHLCAPSQLNIYIPNQHHQCAHIQHNLQATNQCHLCAHIQLFLRTTHQCHHCAPSQLNLLATTQCNLFATSQLNLHANQCHLCCQPQCNWTKWFDVDFPVPGPHGGDQETYSNILKKGEKICHQPEEITRLQCRAENHPEVSVEKLGQVVQCDSNVGLVCHNRDQNGGLGMCLNYEVRVLCCRTPKGCPTIPPVTVPSTPTERTTSVAWSTSHMQTTSSSPTPQTSATSLLLRTTHQRHHCAPSQLNLHANTHCHICALIQFIFCTTHQRHLCAHIQLFLCTTHQCHHCAPSQLNLLATTQCHLFATSQLNLHANNQCHVCAHIQLILHTTHQHHQCAHIQLNLQTNTQCLLCAHIQLFLRTTHQCHLCAPSQLNLLATIQCHLFATSQLNLHANTQFHICAHIQFIFCTTHQCHLCAPSQLNIYIPNQHHQCAHIQHNLQATNQCHLCAHIQLFLRTTHQCHHCAPSQLNLLATTQCNLFATSQLNLHANQCHLCAKNQRLFSETYSNILKKGEKICHQPEEITRLQCRAENHPEVSVEKLGQVVQCDSNVGLVCHNRDQNGGLGMCLNYEVRVLCCRTPKGCPTIPPVTVPSTPTERTTSVAWSTSHMQTTSSSPTPQTSATSVHPASSSSRPPSSATSVHTSSSYSAPHTSATTVHPASSTSTPTPTATSVHSSSSSSAPHTSATSVHTSSSSSAPHTSATTVHPASSTSWPPPSATSLPPASSTSTPTPSATSVHTSSSSSAPHTSATTVHPASSISTSQTSTTSVHTSSTTSRPPTSVTSVHTSSSSSAPHTSATTSPTVTTGCQPQCNWTKWFDVDFPVPGPHGGDQETYSNILKKGEKICHQPEEITRLQCRAENHPEVSVEKLGQVVQCDSNVGLVCHNRDQNGGLGMCLNYEVRVLCCRTPEVCPLTSVTPHLTSPTKTSFPAPSTSATSSPWSQSPTALATTTCFCRVSGKLYPAGSIIYNQTDLASYCYYALCNEHCEVVRGSDQECPSTTSTPMLTSSLSTSTSESVTVQGCPNVVPPRKTGETWAMPNCSQATCKGNQIVTLTPRQCPELKAPTCANGYPALKVYDKEGCCQHYQCQCVCSGWGDPHYITFDGTYYTFLDNCTYVLVQQIVPVYGHFRVLVDNYFCDMEGSISCPQSIIVEYHQDRVVLTRRPVNRVMTNQIIFNDKVVSPGFQKNGIAVSQIGIKMYVTIQEIGVQVMFTGLIFSVEVPFSTFTNNTEGQCGTCTNDQKDECRLPAGEVTTSCSKMASHWKVHTPDQPFCYGPTPTPASASVAPTTSPASCPPSPTCQLILSKVFTRCHAVISPKPFYEGCIFDHCHVTDPEVECSSLELYASLCASFGVCIDWRRWTNNTCLFTCPADKVYQPCGPSSAHFCYGNDNISLLALPEAGNITEGCFCPDSMTLFSNEAQVCVPAHCSMCLGPYGKPVEPGHTVSDDCYECTCEKATLTLSCHRKSCPLPPACPLLGFVPVPIALEAGQCCPQFNCTCNSSYCPEPLECPEGYRRVVSHEEGACCPSQNCSVKSCVVNGTVYQPGDVISSSPCETCRCEEIRNPQGDAFVVSCEAQICNTHCPVGFEYQAQRGQCCGQCVQVACVMNTSSSSVHLYYPNESWADPENHCVSHKCEKLQGGLVVVTVKMECPPLSCTKLASVSIPPFLGLPSDPPGTNGSPLLVQDKAYLSTDGCCYFCPPPAPQTNGLICAMHHRDQIIQQHGCSSAGPVRLSYCQGDCGASTSMYSLEANMVEHTCQCCQEVQTSQRQVTLHCADGSRRAFSYTQVEECGCRGQQCHASDDISPSASSESKSMFKENKEQRQE
ncbi:mucin-5AC [Castor canadensis]|uniref:Mucin-5AC n=1 Tax=Castor canadensis TaxID=51338 RepID=A0AC58LUK2_CASCN